jgi:hypothetical protein
VALAPIVLMLCWSIYALRFICCMAVNKSLCPLARSFNMAYILSKCILGPVDRPFSNGGQLMCHEVFIYVEDIIGSTWVSDTPASNFCKRNFRTPAWVNNVISLHGS